MWAKPASSTTTSSDTPLPPPCPRRRGHSHHFHQRTSQSRCRQPCLRLRACRLASATGGPARPRHLPGPPARPRRLDVRAFPPHAARFPQRCLRTRERPALRRRAVRARLRDALRGAADSQRIGRIRPPGRRRGRHIRRHAQPDCAALAVPRAHRRRARALPGGAHRLLHGGDDRRASQGGNPLRRLAAVRAAPLRCVCGSRLARLLRVPHGRRFRRARNRHRLRRPPQYPQWASAAGW